MVEIIPAILTVDPQELRELIRQAEDVVERVQIDIIDGVFAENKTIDPLVLRGIDTNLKLDFHLMVKEPVNWVEKCVSSGADKRSLRSGDLRIIGQVEQMSSQVEFVGKVQEVGASVGLGIDIDTPVSKIDSTILTNLDVVLVMSVPAGFGGQKFDPSALLRVSELNEVRIRDDTSFRICVDGGVKIENIGRIRKEGADEVSIGRRLFKGNLKENIKRFQKAAYA